jgi:hypothetical protein
MVRKVTFHVDADAMDAIEERTGEPSNLAAGGNRTLVISEAKTVDGKVRRERGDHYAGVVAEERVRVYVNDEATRAQSDYVVGMYRRVLLLVAPLKWILPSDDAGRNAGGRQDRGYMRLRGGNAYGPQAARYPMRDAEIL